jgi:alanyl-tRNA synthetase
VNVLRIGNFSRELCGGTHIRRTGEIGLFKIITETSIAAGIRRIEALVGKLAYQDVKKERIILDELNQKLEAKDSLLVNKIDGLFSTDELLHKQLDILTAKIVDAEVEKIIKNTEIISGIKTIFKDFDYLDMSALRLVADKIRQIEPDNICGFLAASRQGDERIRYILFVSSNLEEKLAANELARNIGKVLEGGGGGKPDMAEGGGKKLKVSAAFEVLKTIIKEKFSTVPENN